MAWTDASGILAKMLLNIPTDKRVQTLMSAINSSKQNDLIQVQDLGMEVGKKRQLKVTYFNQNCEDTSCSTNICEGTPLEPAVKTLGIGECASSSVMQVSLEDIRLADGLNMSDLAVALVKKGMNELRSSLNKGIAAKLVANVGTFPDGSTSKLIPFVDPTNGGVNTMGYFEVMRAVQDAGLDNPYIVGGRDVFTWQNSVGIGGMNQYGQNVGALNANAYYDLALDAAFGDATKGHIISFGANAVKFVSYAKNVGQFGNATPTTIEGVNALTQMFKAGDTYYYGVIVDPYTGLMYDLTIEKAACEPAFNMRLSLQWDLFTMPNMLCNEEGVNGIFHFTTCPTPAVVCPPTSASTYSTIADTTYPIAGATGFIKDGITTPISGGVASFSDLVAKLNAAYPGYVFKGNATNKVISYTGSTATSIVVDATADVTLAFTA